MILNMGILSVCGFETCVRLLVLSVTHVTELGKDCMCDSIECNYTVT